jgi:hypothetical protein
LLEAAGLPPPWNSSAELPQGNVEAGKQLEVDQSDDNTENEATVQESTN